MFRTEQKSFDRFIGRLKNLFKVWNKLEIKILFRFLLKRVDSHLVLISSHLNIREFLWILECLIILVIHKQSGVYIFFWKVRLFLVYTISSKTTDHISQNFSDITISFRDKLGPRRFLKMVIEIYCIWDCLGCPSCFILVRARCPFTSPGKSFFSIFHFTHLSVSRMKNPFSTLILKKVLEILKKSIYLNNPKMLFNLKKKVTEKVLQKSWASLRTLWRLLGFLKKNLVNKKLIWLMNFWLFL